MGVPLSRQCSIIGEQFPQSGLVLGVVKIGYDVFESQIVDHSSGQYDLGIRKDILQRWKNVVAIRSLTGRMRACRSDWGV